MVGSLQYVIARDENVFSDPSAFKPERWLRESGENTVSSTFASVPFGFGPRQCIGRRLAELELYLALARVSLSAVAVRRNYLKKVSRQKMTIGRLRINTRCGLPYVRHFHTMHTGYGTFHCDSMKYDLMLHFKYAVCRMKMPYVLESAASLLSTSFSVLSVR